MAADVVDLFQIVDIENADGKRSTSIPDLPVQLRHCFQVRVTVADAGHQITPALGAGIANIFPQPVLGFLQPLPDGFEIALSFRQRIGIIPGVTTVTQADLLRQLLHFDSQFTGFLMHFP